MTRKITLIRHGETEANTRGGWQGQTDSELTDRGHAQVARLAERLDPPRLLISSDLGRAATSAAALGSAELDPRWREFHFGDWEGLTTAEIEAQFPGGLASLRSESDYRPEGGESTAEFAARILGAMTAVASRLEDGEEAVVVTHGGLIHSLVSFILGADRRRLALPANASATTIVFDDEPLVTRVFIYNDATHLQRDLLPEHPPRVILFRHAETEANVDGRWYGRSETPLTEAGRRQAADLAAAAVSLDLIASSPLSRARDTAASVAAAQKRPVNVVDGLAEMHFGEWEGLTAAEAEAADPEGFRRVYHHGVDEARGRTGETFDEAGNRFAGAVRQLTAGNNHRTIGLFTHGGVARAYIAGLLGVPFADRQRLPELRNTAYAEVVFEPRGTRVASYNVAPHLER